MLLSAVRTTVLTPLVSSSDLRCGTEQWLDELSGAHTIGGRMSSCVMSTDAALESTGAVEHLESTREAARGHAAAAIRGSGRRRGLSWPNGVSPGLAGSERGMRRLERGLVCSSADHLVKSWARTWNTAGSHWSRLVHLACPCRLSTRTDGSDGPLARGTRNVTLRSPRATTTSVRVSRVY